MEFFKCDSLSLFCVAKWLTTWGNLNLLITLGFAALVITFILVVFTQAFISIFKR